MLLRFLLFMVIAALVGVSPVLADDNPNLNLPDCTWQPYAIFTNGHVRAPSLASKAEPLYLRRAPSYEAMLRDTAPFDWPNAECVLPPDLRLRVADWGKPKDRFAKVYYDGNIFWVSKTYRDGTPSLISVTAETSTIPRKMRKRR